MLREGLLVVVCGPSGVGKGTVLKQLKEQNSNIRFSVSATTRQPRLGEIDGTNYFFKTVPEFRSMIQNNELVEWVEYCDNYYGTPKKYISDCLACGYDVVMEIEVEGAENIKKAYPESVSVFILPPSFDDLKRRIQGRGTEDANVINKRLERAKKELSYIDKYDYIIINDTVENALVGLGSVLASEKLRYKRNVDILKTIGI